MLISFRGFQWMSVSAVSRMLALHLLSGEFIIQPRQHYSGRFAYRFAAIPSELAYPFPRGSVPKETHYEHSSVSHHIVGVVQ